MEMIGKVRRMHSRDKKSVRQIARMTGLSRNTVAKWLAAPVQERPKYRRAPQLTKLAPFHAGVVQALKADARRPKHERRTARALHEELKAAGYDGGYSRLTDFIRAWREGEGQAVHAGAFVPLAFGLGEAFQFDWSEEGLAIAGVYRRLQVAHMKLCASRAFWLGAYPTQGHERCRLLQCRLGLGEGHCREERAGQPPARVARSDEPPLGQLDRAECVARAALPRVVAAVASSRA
jgi:transposase